MARRRGGVKVSLAGELFEGEVAPKVNEALRGAVFGMGSIALDLAKDNWQTRAKTGRFVRSLDDFRSRTEPYVGIRSKNYGRPYRSRWREHDFTYGTLLETGRYRNRKVRRGYRIFARVYRFVKAMNMDGWYGDAVSKRLNQ